MKWIKGNTMGIIVGVLLSATLDVIAEIAIPSESVSYSNSKTSETTVEGSLNELFSAIKINEKIGNTDISTISDGTITGSISSLNSSVTNSYKPAEDEDSFYTGNIDELHYASDTGGYWTKTGVTTGTFPTNCSVSACHYLVYFFAISKNGGGMQIAKLYKTDGLYVREFINNAWTDWIAV